MYLNKFGIEVLIDDFFCLLLTLETEMCSLKTEANIQTLTANLCSLLEYFQLSYSLLYSYYDPKFGFLFLYNTLVLLSSLLFSILFNFTRLFLESFIL
jgi:hypothetical protein